jgi:chromosome segregation ATPase
MSKERVAALTDQTAAALAAARSSLGSAAVTTENVRQVLRRSEGDIAELAGQATRVRYADEPRPYLRNAQELAEDVDRRMRDGQRGLGEVGDDLEQATRALDAGRQFVAELEQLPERQVAETEHLRQRVEALSSAVRNAGDVVQDVGARLGAARQNVEPLLESSGHVDDRDRTAAMIAQAGSGVDNDVMSVQRRLAGLSENLDHAQPQAAAAAHLGADLANTARVAANPTKASDQSKPGSAADQDPHRRTNEPAHSALRDL